MIQAVLFDLDETLFDRTSALIACIRGQHNRFGEISHRVSQDLYLSSFIELDQHGYANRDLLYAQLLDKFGLPQSLHGQLSRDWHTNYLAQGKGFVGMHETLTALQRSMLRLGLVTNGSTKTQQCKIDQLEIARYFDAILISEAIGIRKPDPRIFELALYLLKKGGQRQGK